MASGAVIQLDQLLKLRHSAKDIKLFARSKSHSQLAGSTSTRFRGRGLEFEEVRHYQPGDELRAIDWRVTARTGDAHTKLFHEERERPVLIAIDQRLSMGFGSQRCFKSVQAAELAALIGWATLQHNDRLGGLVFNDQQHNEIRPARNRSAVLHLLNTVHRYNQQLVDVKLARQQNASQINEVMKELRRIARPGSALFIISDFNGLNQDGMKQLHQIRRHCDVNALLVYDAMEWHLPTQGIAAFTDGEKRALFQTDNRQLTAEFSQRFEQRFATLQHRLASSGIPLLPLTTYDNALEVLLHYYRPSSNRAQPLFNDPLRQHIAARSPAFSRGANQP